MSGISNSQVSRLCSEIDERVSAFLDRPLEGDLAVHVAIVRLVGAPLTDP